MDPSTPRILASTGVRCLIGKGPRSPEVVSALKKYGAVYLAAVGGVAALLQRCIRSSTIVWAEDLGTEAVRRLEVQDFPAIVAIDTLGGNLYESAP
jgi:fumarate hydratase subunit beta